MPSVNETGEQPNFIPDHRMNMKFGLAPGDCESDPINNCLEKAIERFQPAYMLKHGLRG